MVVGLWPWVPVSDTPYMRNVNHLHAFRVVAVASDATSNRDVVLCQGRADWAKALALSKTKVMLHNFGLLFS